MSSTIDPAPLTGARVAVNWIVIALLYCGFCALASLVQRDTDRVITLLAQIDLLEASAIYCCCLFILALAWPVSVLGRSQGARPVATSIAGFAAVLAPAAVFYRRPPYAVNLPLLAACAWSAINLALAHWARGERPRAVKLRNLAARAPFAFDALLPLYASALTRRGRGAILRLASRIASAGLIALAPLAALLGAPSSFDLLADPSPDVHLLSNWTGYQVLLDPQRGAAWSTDKISGLYRYDLPIQHDRSRRIGLRSKETQEAALLPQSGGLLFVERDELIVWAVDSSGRVLSKIGRLEGRASGSVRPLLPGVAYDLIVASENTGLLAYDFDSAQPKAEYRLPGGTTPATLVDPVRQRVYVTIETLGLLVELDLNDLKPLRSLKIGRGLGNLCLDARNNVAWLPMPSRGRVLKIDLTAWRVEPGLEAAPGVRVAAIDSQRELLVCGGFSGYLEIFDLRDNQLLARLWASPWQRAIELDLERGQAYVNTAISGIYSVDYAVAAERARQGAERPARRPLWLAVHALGSDLSTGLFEQIWADKWIDD